MKLRSGESSKRSCDSGPELDTQWKEETIQIPLFSALKKNKKLLSVELKYELMVFEQADLTNV